MTNAWHNSFNRLQRSRPSAAEEVIDDLLRPRRCRHHYPVSLVRESWTLYGAGIPARPGDHKQLRYPREPLNLRSTWSRLRVLPLLSGVSLGRRPLPATLFGFTLTGLDDKRRCAVAFGMAWAEARAGAWRTPPGPCAGPATRGLPWRSWTGAWQAARRLCSGLRDAAIARAVQDRVHMLAKRSARSRSAAVLPRPISPTLLNCGEIHCARLRRTLQALPSARLRRRHRDAAAVDVSSWLRPRRRRPGPEKMFGPRLSARGEAERADDPGLAAPGWRHVYDGPQPANAAARTT